MTTYNTRKVYGATDTRFSTRRLERKRRHAAHSCGDMLEKGSPVTAREDS